MMSILWNFNDISEFSYDIENDYKKSFEEEYFEDGNSPPPPYSEVDQLNKEVLKRNSSSLNNDFIKSAKQTFKYNDVGEEFYITIPTKPNVEIGLIILSGKNFRPSWPAILDIKKNSLASEFTSLRIGDQIKELCGIPTETLSHRQVAALFRKATDQIQMTVRRGLEVSDRSFDWFRYPFSSVSQNYEDITLKNEPKKNTNPKTKATFTSFRCTQEKKPCKEKLILKKLESMRKYSHDYTRSMTMPLNRKVMHLPRQRALSSASDDDLVAYKFNLMNMTSPMNEGKFIVNEVEKIEKEKTMMTSAFSSSTISSFSSTSTSATQENLMSSHGSNTQHHWMDNVIRTPEDDVIEPEGMSQSHFDNGTEIIKNICRSPVNTFRNTLRKRKDKKEQIEAEEINPKEKSILHGGSSGNAFLVTVWIGDRKKLGLKIGGGSVSPYGDSTLNVLEIRKSGTASKVFKIGDEILEIDSMVTTGMNVYEANSMISKLEGNYVEFKIFRPTKK